MECAKTYLTPELSFEIKDEFAMRMSDNDRADRLQKIDYKKNGKVCSACFMDRT